MDKAAGDCWNSPAHWQFTGLVGCLADYCCGLPVKQAEGAFISSIVIGELCSGAEKSSRPAENVGFCQMSGRGSQATPGEDRHLQRHRPSRSRRRMWVLQAHTANV